MKLLVFIVGIFLVLNFAFAIEITEIELNPKGADAGNEWIEFYSEKNVSLDRYKLVNNDGDEINLNGTIEGYYVYEFEKQWLDNSDEKVFLYEDNEIIDETEVIKDTENDEKTWQVCNGQWKFEDFTREGRNICNKEGNSIEEEREENDYIESFEDVDEVEESQSELELIEEPLQKTAVKNVKKTDGADTERVINLNPQSHKSERLVYESKNEKIRKYSIYGFAILLILIIVLVIRD